jgi:hypothetical protein
LNDNINCSVTDRRIYRVEVQKGAPAACMTAGRPEGKSILTVEWRFVADWNKRANRIAAKG